MKKVTKYQSNDGNLFDTENEAVTHDLYISIIETLTQTVLPKKCDNCDFANGGGFIQLTEKQVEYLTKGFQDLIKTFHPSTYERARVDENPRGIIGRYLDDGDDPAYRLWGLLNCIDDQNRLWGQPFYANHPEKGIQKQLNREV